MRRHEYHWYYAGTYVNVADVLPVPRRVLASSTPKQKSSGEKGSTSSLDHSPLDRLKRQEKQGRDEKALRRDCIKLGVLVSGWVGAVTVSKRISARSHTRSCGMCAGS